MPVDDEFHLSSMLEHKNNHSTINEVTIHTMYIGVCEKYYSVYGVSICHPRSFYAGAVGLVLSTCSPYAQEKQVYCGLR